MKKEQGTKTKERKKPESKQTTGASEEKPLTTLRKEGKLKNNNKQTNKQGEAQISLNFFTNKNLINCLKFFPTSESWEYGEDEAMNERAQEQVQCVFSTPYLH